MKKFLLAAILLLTSQGFAGEFLVKYKNSGAFQMLHEMETQGATGMTIMSHHEVGSWFKVNIQKSVEGQMIAQMLMNPSIEWVVPNFKLHSFANVPVEATALKDQWAITKVQAAKAWDRAGNKGNRKILLAVIDTGADYKHPNLVANMVPGFNFKDNNSDPMDVTSAQNPGHGTHCSGIIGATGSVDGGTIGISPEVSIMPLRFLGPDGQGTLEDAVKAIDYAIEKGVMVISASWGAAIPRPQATALLEAIKRADDKGIIFVAAAANDGKNNDQTDVFPANSGFPNTISVAASGNSDEKPSWSNFGTATVHLASPGLNIISTLPQNKYGPLSGTSMATPLVAGLVAFLKAQDETLTGAQIRALLQSSGAKANIETACHCRVDAFAAVDTLLSKKMWVVPAAATLAVNESVNLNVMNGQAPFKFTSSNPAALTVTDGGVVKAMASGKATISVTDASGKSASSLDFYAGQASTPAPAPGPAPGPAPAPGGECPLGDPSLCQIACTVSPTLPWCQSAR